MSIRRAGQLEVVAAASARARRARRATSSLVGGGRVGRVRAARRAPRRAPPARRRAPRAAPARGARPPASRRSPRRRPRRAAWPRRSPGRRRFCSRLEPLDLRQQLAPARVELEHAVEPRVAAVAAAGQRGAHASGSARIALRSSTARRLAGRGTASGVALWRRYSTRSRNSRPSAAARAINARYVRGESAARPAAASGRRGANAGGPPRETDETPHMWHAVQSHPCRASGARRKCSRRARAVRRGTAGESRSGVAVRRERAIHRVRRRPASHQCAVRAPRVGGGWNCAGTRRGGIRLNPAPPRRRAAGKRPTSGTAPSPRLTVGQRRARPVARGDRGLEPPLARGHEVGIADAADEHERARPRPDARAALEPGAGLVGAHAPAARPASSSPAAPRSASASRRSRLTSGSATGTPCSSSAAGGGNARRPPTSGPSASRSASLRRAACAVEMRCPMIAHTSASHGVANSTGRRPG